MARTLKPVPTFANEAEERHFWETHDSSAYLDWNTAQRARMPNLKPTQTAISLRLPMPLLERIKVAVPGTLTTAYLALKIFNPAIETVTVSFDRIIPEILAGSFEAGLIIHEGQLTYSSSGLRKVIDLGVWWRETTGLVLPLGGNAIRRSLGADPMRIVTKAVRDSIQHALDNREAALEYAMQFARDLDPRLANRFVSMYVNERTLDYGPDGREAIRKLLELGHLRNIIPIEPKVDFVD